MNETLARYARQHNGANVLALGVDAACRRPRPLAIVDVFIDTPMREARYIRRLAKIRELETRPRTLMAAPDLERLIRIIVEEVAAAQATAAPVRCALPRGAVRVLPRPAARGASRRARRGWACTPRAAAPAAWRR